MVKSPLKRFFDETTGRVYEYVYKYTRLLNKTGNDIELICEWGLNLRGQENLRKLPIW